MKALRSPLLYLPLIALFSVSNSVQDLGLWPRFLFLGLTTIALALYGRKTQLNLFAPIGVALAGFTLWAFTGFGHSTASSELWAHISRLALIWALAGAGALAFIKDGESALEALSKGSAIALLLSSFSLLPSLSEAYKAGDIYLASGALFTHKNYAASALLLLLPLALLRIPKGGMKYVHWAAIALGILDILLLRTRGVWLGLVAMVVVAVIFYVSQGARNWLNKSLIAGSIIISGIVLTAVFVGREKIINSDTIQTRFHYWNASTELFLEHPITGVGGGQWKIWYPSTGLKGTNESVMNGATNILRPHNDVLWVLSEMGAPGALLFLAVLLLGFIGLWRGKEIYLALVVVGFAAYGLGEFPLERATTLWPLAVALAYVWSQSEAKKSTLNRNAWMLVLALALGTTYISYFRVAGESEAKKVIEAYISRNNRSMLQHAQKTSNVFFEMDIFNNPAQYFEGLGYLMSAGGQNPGPQLLAKAEGKFEEALDIHPYHMSSKHQLGAIAAMKGKHQVAVKHFKEVLSYSPRHLQCALGLSESQRALGNYNEAIISLHLISPSYTPANNVSLRNKGMATLQAFARSTHPRKDLAGLHKALQGKGQQQMWEAWMNWRRAQWKKTGI